jgi:hypothetical protein
MIGYHSCGRSDYPTPRQTTPFSKVGGESRARLGLLARFSLKPNGHLDNSSSLHVQSSMQGIDVDRIVSTCHVASFQEGTDARFMQGYQCGRSCRLTGSDDLLLRALIVLRRGLWFTFGFRGTSKVPRVPRLGSC